MTPDQPSNGIRKWIVVVISLIVGLIGLVVVSINLSIAASASGNKASSELSSHLNRREAERQHLNETLVRLEDGQAKNHELIVKLLQESGGS